MKIKKIALFTAIVICVAFFFSEPLIKNFPKHCAVQETQPSFALHNIMSIFPSDPKWITPCENGVKEMLSQKFTYLDEGGQCYAFLSEDHDYVLKVFKQQKFAKKRNASKKRDALFRSYKVAYDLLREETGLVFLHIVPGDGFQQQVTLVDHLNVPYIVELGDIEFILQKRVALIQPTITSKMQEQKAEEAKKILDALFLFFHNRLDKEILDGDPAIVTNFGLLDGKIIQIDIGRFSTGSTRKNLEDDLGQFKRKNTVFQAWLIENYPDLAVHYDNLCRILEQRYTGV